MSSSPQVLRALARVTCSNRSATLSFFFGHPVQEPILRIFYQSSLSVNKRALLQGEPRYGIGVVFQWCCPLVSLELNQPQKHPGMDALRAPNAFSLRLTDLHTNVALEGDGKDVRSVHAFMTILKVAAGACYHVLQK